MPFLRGSCSPAFPGAGERCRGWRDPRYGSSGAALHHPAGWNDHAVAYRRTRSSAAPPVRGPRDAAVTRRCGGFRLPCTRSRLQHGPMSDPTAPSPSPGDASRAGADGAVRPRSARHHRRPGAADPGHRVRGDGRRHRDARGDRRPRRGVGLRVAVLGVPRRVRVRHRAGRALVRRRRARGPRSSSRPWCSQPGWSSRAPPDTLAQLLVGRVLQGASAGAQFVAVVRRRSPRCTRSGPDRRCSG